MFKINCNVSRRIQRPGKGGAEKYEIYAATFGGHLFYDLFSKGGGHFPHRPPAGSATECNVNVSLAFVKYFLKLSAKLKLLVRQ